jgi:hypothetical protein
MMHREVADEADSAMLVEIFDAQVDLEELDQLTRSLRRELLELDVDSVEQATAGPAPDGTRGLEVAAVGALLVKAQASAELLGKLVGLVRGWLRGARGESRTLRLTIDGQSIELIQATDAQQQQLVDEFIRAVAKA